MPYYYKDPMVDRLIIVGHVITDRTCSILRLAYMTAPLPPYRALPLPLLIIGIGIGVNNSWGPELLLEGCWCPYNSMGYAEGNNY